MLLVFAALCKGRFLGICWIESPKGSRFALRASDAAIHLRVALVGALVAYGRYGSGTEENRDQLTILTSVDM